jgi:hypothetical protein
MGTIDGRLLAVIWQLFVTGELSLTNLQGGAALPQRCAETDASPP